MSKVNINLKKYRKIILEQVRILKNDKNVEGIVLFGSMVHGKVHKNSDIDLKIYVKNFSGPKTNNIMYDGISVSLCYFPLPPDSKEYEFLLIKDLLNPFHYFY